MQTDVCLKFYHITTSNNFLDILIHLEYPNNYSDKSVLFQITYNISVWAVVLIA